MEQGIREDNQAQRVAWQSSQLVLYNKSCGLCQLFDRRQKTAPQDTKGSYCGQFEDLRSS